MKFSPEQEQSEFNQGIATLMRIHGVLTELNLASFEQDFRSRYKFLIILYQEIRPMMNNTERKDFTEAKNTLDLASKDLRGKLTKKNKVIPGSIVNVFDEFEQGLRDIIQKKNMGLPQKADSRHALKSGK